VLLLAQLPAVVRRLPVFGVFDGPLGIVLAATALLVTVGQALAPRVGPGLRERATGRAPRTLFGLAFLLLAPFAVYYATSLRASGDEPHYLLMAQSLWREGDLDLRDNLAREDFREYTPGPVQPHYGAPRADGRPFPAHSPGLPLLLAPAYALLGRAGCVLVLAALGAWLALELRWWAEKTGADPEGALLAWALVFVPPALFFTFHVYTELPCAVAAAAALRWVDVGKGAARPSRVVGAALLAGALPWLHVKMGAAAAVIGLVALVRLRGRALAAFLATAGLMAAGLLLHYWRVYGVASPLALYGGAPIAQAGDPVRALLGLLLDRSFGLLPHAPVFLLAFPGLALLLRRRAWPLLALGASVLAPVVVWRMWWGGQSPPARFLVPALAALAAAVAATCGDRRGLGRWRWVLLALSLAMGLGMAGEPDARLLVNRGDRPTRVWTALSGAHDVGRYLPSLTYPETEEMRVAMVWMAALAVVLALHAFALRRERADRLFRGLGLPLVLVLAVGAAVDRWARPAADAGVSSTGAGASGAVPRAGPPPRPE
jgi:hypothetical protein